MPEHLDLKFLRTAMIEESVPIVTDRHLPRTDILFDLHRLHMHPMMFVEVMWHKQPAVWLRKIDEEIAKQAAATADRLTLELHVAGREDRAMIVTAPDASYEELDRVLLDISDAAYEQMLVALADAGDTLEP